MKYLGMITAALIFAGTAVAQEKPIETPDAGDVSEKACEDCNYQLVYSDRGHGLEVEDLDSSNELDPVSGGGQDIETESAAPADVAAGTTETDGHITLVRSAAPAGDTADNDCDGDCDDIPPANHNTVRASKKR